MNEPKSQQVRTGRLLLRAFEQDDYKQIYSNWQSDPETFRYLEQSSCRDLEDSYRYCRARIPYYGIPYFFDWVIVQEDTKQPIGEFNAAYRHRTNSVNVGFCLGSKFWNNGYMSEIIPVMLQFFADAGIASAEAECHRDNTVSRHVLEKSGFTLDGFLPESKLYHYSKKLK
ncbi:MAG: GNAT family N-acetyltransferase [Solobacterium sp.]|nr:GNAT family N-acetyltransferase [Solobacterium sp.]